MMGALLLASSASAGETALDADGVWRAAWRRDAGALLDARYEDSGLAVLPWALAGLHDAAALERLTLLAGLADPATRSAAAFALGHTPGGATVLRKRLAEEADDGVSVALLRALGLAGAASDVPALVQRASRPGRVGEAAADALGVLAQRGEDVAGAVPILVETLFVWDPARVRAAAFALRRIAPPVLSVKLVTRLTARFERLADGRARADLAAVLMDHLTGPARRRFVLAALEDTHRLTRVEVLQRVSLAELSEAAWSSLAADADPWVRQIVSARRGESDWLDAVAGGRADKASVARALAQVAQGEDPAGRSRAAVALLAHSDGRTVERVRTLLSAPDPVVRELALEALVGLPTWQRDLLEPMLAAAREVPTRRVALRVLQRWTGEVPPALEAEVRAWSGGSEVLVAAVAARWLRARGLAEATRAAGLPGPPQMEQLLTTVDEVRGAVVTTTAGTIRVTLEPEVAPLTVAAFAWLADHDRFDDVAVHRVVPGFVAQTGDPRGDGMGGPTWMIPDELTDRTFDEGAVGMARAGWDTAGSQWFITLSDQRHLRGRYTWFGHVSRGMEVARALTTSDRVMDVTIERVSRTPEAP